ncbi:hypothetical protein CAMRE0001_2618 [Campylobacter rectus RM3267]|uniref:Uncharacterized protein n=1 Tax=Campylobacter rectus RM3267 TaxID=553218 RepID=B9D447_CAMRE|nr:hypothetical protein [Campylobacter rectus]EEF13267.1 hypothetical protein CAMRE0001_2618 [Campylobacter rectus RM3267]UEB47250.1 hypothetical protein LK437_09605 [Campylobacter rectus]
MASAKPRCALLQNLSKSKNRNLTEFYAIAVEFAHLNLSAYLTAKTVTSTPKPA